MSNFTLVLDAGHGGNDPGAVGNGLQEKDLTLSICQLAQAHIKRNYPSINCLLTRASDVTTTLHSRTAFANRNKADALVSVHVNSAASTAANGFESFVYTTDGPESKSVGLQKKLHQPLAKLWTSKGRADRGQKKANFHMVREFKGASVLVEFGFIVNKQDSDLLKNASFVQANAIALADAIAEYFGVTKSVTNKPVSTAKAGVYRVLVDGSQTGAYADPSNIANAVFTAVSSGKKKIEIELAK